jgi:hypothetical protein
VERRVRSLKIRAEDARRARVILMLAAGDTYSTIEATVPCYRDYINRWRWRFLADGLEGLRARYDRLDPVLPLSPGRAERHGFEYHRHGTLSLFAELNTQSGEVLGQTMPRHTSAAFVDCLGDIVASQPKWREIHVIADNLRPTRRRRFARSCSRIQTSACISRPPIRHGSTKSNCGLRRSSGTS